MKPIDNALLIQIQVITLHSNLFDTAWTVLVFHSCVGCFNGWSECPRGGL